MRAWWAALALAMAGCGGAAKRDVRQLAAGTMELHSPIEIGARTELRGAPGGTTLHMAADFHGAAAVIVTGEGAWLHDFAIDGNRAALERRQELPPYDTPFDRFTANNGILAHDSGLTVERVQFRNIAGFAVLAARVERVSIEGVTVEDSGSRNPAGRNNATGGILFEEGSADFRVAHSTFRNILGNALWTHSLYTSPRNRRGAFVGNRFETVGRDAIQVGHAQGFTVADNSGERVGFPPGAQDAAVPVAIDTAGNVEDAHYVGNRFFEIDGKCMDLDGMHDSEVRGNLCANREPAAAYPLGNYAIVMNDTNPDMRTHNINISGNRIERPVFGGIFVIGENNLIERNLLLDLNQAHCNQNVAHYQCNYAPADPHILDTGIYLGRGAERPAPARGNIIENNTVTGWGMRQRCVGRAPGVSADWNTVRDNRCY